MLLRSARSSCHHPRGLDSNSGNDLVVGHDRQLRERLLEQPAQVPPDPARADRAPAGAPDWVTRSTSGSRRPTSACARAGSIAITSPSCVWARDSATSCSRAGSIEIARSVLSTPRYGAVIVRPSAWRAASASSAGSRVSSARSPIASRIVPRSRIETPSRSRCCSARCTSPTPSLSGTTSSTAARVLLLERVEQLARLLAREQLVGVAADRLGEVRDDHRLGVDDRVAERLGLGAGALLDPDGGQPEGGLDRRDAGRGPGSRRRRPSPAGGRGRRGRAPPRRRAP